MSDWQFLEKHRVVRPTRSVPEHYISDASWGFNGMFRLPHDSTIVRCVASDGSYRTAEPERQWQHVSVSIEGDHRPPRWSVMCWVKDLFWESEQWVCQFHPAKSEYVNYHPGVLHLWRPTAVPLPTPLAIMVGPKGIELSKRDVTG